MREILFRAKAINRDTGYHRTEYKNGDWVYGLITKPHYDDFPTIPMEMRNTDGIDGIDVDYKTVGQFIGLTDKNGTKIFEGDIVKENDIFHNGELQIKGNAWQVVFADGLFFGNYKDISVYLQSLDGMEVIGNIHDNPELLEQK